MRACGYSIYRTATDQLENGYAVSYSDLQPGDLVLRADLQHRCSRFPRGHLCRRRRVHPRRWQLRQISSLSSDYYASRYVGARRIV